MNSFNQSLWGRCGGGCWEAPVSCPSIVGQQALAGCQPGVSWSMLVKRALIWVWQGNQQPNSTVKLNSAVEHRSASFMLRLQKGKVPQHQFVTESCGTELTLATKQWGRERERRRQRERKRAYVCVCVCIFVCGQVSVLSTITSPTSSNNGREKEGFTSAVWVGWTRKREEKAESEQREREVGLFQGPWAKKNSDSSAARWLLVLLFPFFKPLLWKSNKKY